jgi:Domain of unknown function (DUF5919)
VRDRLIWPMGVSSVSHLCPCPPVALRTHAATQRNGGTLTGQPTLLAVLLESKGLHRYGTFRAAYDKAARAVDRNLSGTAPSRAQFHRWVTGNLRSLPYPDHCRVLEHLLTGYAAVQLFEPCPDNGVPAPARLAARTTQATSQSGAKHDCADLADLAAVFASRSDFAAKVQAAELFDGASRIRAAGLSLNLICQQLPDQQLRRMLTDGTHLTCLFLDPEGEAIKAREREEEYPEGFLSGLNSLNIQVMARHRDRLPTEVRDRMQLRVYDETVRFNIVLVDEQVCVVQPYLPQARGVDSPTLLIRRQSASGGLYPIFEQVYEAIAERSREI